MKNQLVGVVARTFVSSWSTWEHAFCNTWCFRRTTRSTCEKELSLFGKCHGFRPSHSWVSCCHSHNCSPQYPLPLVQWKGELGSKMGKAGSSLQVVIRRGRGEIIEQCEEGMNNRNKSNCRAAIYKPSNKDSILTKPRMANHTRAWWETTDFLSSMGRLILTQHMWYR